MILQDSKKTKGSIQKPLRITKGNNSNSIGPLPLIFISSIGHILMNVFAKFDEIPSMILQDIKKKIRYGHKKRFGHTVGQRENSIPSHKHSLRGYDNENKTIMK